MVDETEVKADDSDYYTPEDPHTTILSPVKSPSEPVEKVIFDYLIFRSSVLTFSIFNP
jgi:hypothetical protein